MFTVLDPLLEFTYHLLFSWRKFALCIQSLLCMLFLFGWPPCQRSDMILMEVSQHANDMIHYISGLFDYFYVCEIYVNLIWYLYLFMLNKFCLSLSLYICMYIPYTSSVIGRIYNGSVIQYWRSCTPSRSIGLFLGSARFLGWMPLFVFFGLPIVSCSLIKI